jgi:hypothetical protein
VKYENLVALIERRGIRKSALAQSIGITSRALSNKLTGKSDFTWSQVCEIQSRFFPDVPREVLFKDDDKPA